ncbi:hypothetical protein PF008_g20301 [Phytophthora fragariae]|uniref:Uncharacterized protein n=1 Tax=Phytophthora fragariae TaxID=53985 RepID=A0A6G0R050_9STRA|nr:hypothetical protein PF008_g20301 [Phytophthora fragariae]
MATCTQVGTGTRLACALLSLPDWVARPVTTPPPDFWESSSSICQLPLSGENHS